MKQWEETEMSGSDDRLRSRTGVPKAIHRARALLSFGLVVLFIGDAMPVSAKGIILDAERGASGASVQGRYPLLFQNARVAKADLFLLPLDASAAPSVSDPRLVPLGPFVREGVDGVITFTVPEVVPGPYAIIARLCFDCAGHDDSIFQAGAFFVQPSGTEGTADAHVLYTLLAVASAIGLVVITVRPSWAIRAGRD
jgi:hypothetical protein